jgi:hypothetical protein
VSATGVPTVIAWLSPLLAESKKMLAITTAVVAAPAKRSRTR